MLDRQLELSPDTLKTVRAFIAFINNPDRTEAVFDIADGLRQIAPDLNRQYIDFVISQPAVTQILQERYLAPIPDLDNMLDLPQESLGYHYATQMKRQGFQPDFYRKLDVKDDDSYITIRTGQTHDIWHIITGFGTDLEGEMGLQAFALAQTRSPLPIAIMTGSLMYILKSSNSLKPLIEKMQRGWQMGESAQSFLAQKWEEDWKKPLSEWRADLKVIPVR
jgi:ubiquinone biosynthesis protein COQ4